MVPPPSPYYPPAIEDVLRLLEHHPRTARGLASARRHRRGLRARLRRPATDT